MVMSRSVENVEALGSVVWVLWVGEEGLEGGRAMGSRVVH